MKYLFYILTATLLLCFTLAACNPAETSSEKSVQESSMQTQKPEGQSTYVDTADYSKFETLLGLMFDCPDQEMLETVFETADHIGEGVSSAGGADSTAGESSLDAASYFSPYVSEKYLSVFMGGYSMNGHMAFEGNGVSRVESITVQSAEDSDNKKLILLVECEGNDTAAEILEITGTFRLDEEGRLESIKFSTGYSEYLSYFQDAQKKRLEAFFMLCFTCPNQEIADAIISTDGGYFAEGSFVSGSGETMEQKFQKLFREYVERDYVHSLLEYVGANYIAAAETGSSSIVELLDIVTSAEQYGFTAHILCTGGDGEQTKIELKGTLRLSAAGKVEMMKINSGFDTYLRALRGSDGL